MAQDYKLKLDKLDLKNGEKREVEVDGIEGGKVLLVRVGDKTHAMSSNCTHYGAPLKLGVVNPEGRLTCAWHGACFNIETGDVEDSPALDPLAKFPIKEKDGAIYITGEEGIIKASRRTANVKCSPQGQEKVVIVGGGSGSQGALEGLRGGNFKGHITLITREGYTPIDRTKLSKALIQDPSKIALRDDSWYSSAGIDIVKDEVDAVNFAGKKVSTKNGQTFNYTKLILAMGGAPKMLPMEGIKDLGNVFKLRTIHDVKDILATVGKAEGKKVVVIGSSFIGMEVANALASQKQSVSVIGMDEIPMQAILGDQVGKVLRSNLEKNGVTFYMGAGVEKASPSSSDSSKVGAVHLKGGKQIPADLVILGVGVAPATEFLKEAKEITLEKDGSIKTDESFQVAGLDGAVYAIGDIATFPYHGPGSDGSYTRIEHWNVAQNAGRSVGSTLARGTGPKKFIPTFWSAQGGQLRYCGNTPHGFDDIVMQGQPEKEGKFAAFYTKGDTVVAVATMGMDPIMVKSAELMRRRGMPGKAQLKGGVDVLEVQQPAELKI
ncbi:MAG: hypothetical protein M1817_000218 [Caeruleum heppii]|nr:MAG: hypothetical protein M1817_000218 [Caeruleum heppii]